MVIRLRSGKTFTMEGKKDDIKNYGIIPNSFAHVFMEIAKANKDVGYDGEGGRGRIRRDLFVQLPGQRFVPGDLQ